MTDAAQSHATEMSDDVSAVSAADLDTIDEDLQLMNEALAALDADDLDEAEALASQLA